MAQPISTVRYLLVLNAGSATLKWALYEAGSLHEIGRGVVERIGTKASFSEFRLQGTTLVREQNFRDHKAAMAYVFKALAWHKFKHTSIAAVGHRVVHGGEHHQPMVLNAAGLRSLERLSPLAPLHNPIELLVARMAKRVLPRAKQVAVFDTSWFVELPEHARSYALPLELTRRYKIKRYGFHGISHAYVAQEASRRLAKPLAALNLITCHLGSGSSVTAVREGRAVDTSMGYTPLEGLVMGTRAGDLDPGIVLFLAQQRGMTSAKLRKLLYEESGLKGVAGVADMREVLVRAGYEVLGFKALEKVSVAERRAAQLAFKMFLYRVQKYIGAYAAILGHVDAIVFTGGIGERNEAVRNLIMRGLPTLSGIPVLAIPTNEELAIAREIVNR